MIDVGATRTEPGGGGNTLRGFVRYTRVMGFLASLGMTGARTSDKLLRE
jgi:hypothetical protein